MITITKEATAKISDIIVEENNLNLKLRLYVQGGGCSGFQYGFILEEEVNEDDMEFKVEIPKYDENDSEFLAYRIESLRMELEDELGPEIFLKAYKTMREIGDSDDDKLNKKVNLILGKKAHCAQKLIQLSFCEDKVYLSLFI